MKLDLIAISKGEFRGSDLKIGQVLELSDTLELVDQEFFFGCKLLRIVEVLVMAAAALGEVWAGGFDSIGGSFKNFDQMGAEEAVFFFPNFDFGYFTGENERGENRPSIREPSEAIASVN